MEARVKLRTSSICLPACSVLVGVVLILGTLAHPARAYTPESPEVQRLVQSALTFLNGKSHKELGGKCLIGLAFVKADQPHTHPNIVAAAEACQKFASRDVSGPPGIHDIYSVGIAVIFLCELDPEKYRKEIEVLLGFLEDRQKNHGGWGYPEKETGDTSMTQYGVLSAWSAKQAGIRVDDRRMERVIGWLQRTQDPSGGWTYQGVDPGHYRGIAQDPARLDQSMTAAGAGSVLMAAHMLGAIRIRDESPVEGLPGALRLVDTSRAATTDETSNEPAVDRAQIDESISRANNWFGSNYFNDWGHYTYYYLYSLERYMSFRELVDGRRAKDTGWYDEGVELLAREQESDGSWKAISPTEIDTSFAVLFLLRSTRKSIRRAMGYGDQLNGGRTLPSNVANPEIKGNRIVGDAFTRKADEIINILNDPNHPDFEELMQSGQDAFFNVNDELDDDQVAKLRQLISGGEPAVRRLAVRALARGRDLDHVPLLIYGLTDPDWPVVREARNGLRFVSRKFRGYGIPDQEDNEKRLVAIKRWKEWYLTIRPEAMFEN